MKPKEGQAPFRFAVIACGALAAHVRQIARRRRWDVDVHPVPALLHNRPDRIAGVVEREVARLAGDYDRVAVAYADCGTYGGLDAVLARTGTPRLAGEHCSDVFAHDDVRAGLLDRTPIGRDEEGEDVFWLRRHDDYEDTGPGRAA